MKYSRIPRLLSFLLLLCPIAKCDTEYYHHILFDNSLEADAYYYSEGRASSPSSLELIHGRLPVSIARSQDVTWDQEIDLLFVDGSHDYDKAVPNL